MSVALQNGLGVASRISTPAEAARLCPLAGLEDVLAASFCPLDGHASPEAVVQGYATGARAHGARLETGCEVLAVETEGGAIRARRHPERHRRDGDRRLRRRRLVSGACGDWPASSCRSRPTTRGRLHRAGAGAAGAAPAHDRLLDRLLLPPRGAGPALRDGRRGPGARVRRAERPRLAGEGAGRGRAARACALGAGTRGRLEGLLRGDPRPQRADRRGGGTWRASSTRRASPGTASSRRPAVGEIVRDLVLGRKPFVDVTPLSAERFARGAARPERNVV